MPGKFVVKQGSTGKFRFSLVSTNGQVVATSQTYATKATCMNGVRSVRKLAADAGLEDQTTRAWSDGAADRKAAAAAKRAAARKRKAAAKAS